MIGIDIVDLHDPLLGPRNHRALRMIQHPEDIFTDIIDPFWPLWTAKEAVFKAFRTNEPFSPVTIPVHIEIKLHACARFQSGPYHGLIYRSNHYVLAICGREGLPYFELHYHPQAADGELIRQKWHQLHPEMGSIIPDERGLPCLSSTGQPLSLSHHGNYSGYAIMM